MSILTALVVIPIRASTPQPIIDRVEKAASSALFLDESGDRYAIRFTTFTEVQHPGLQSKEKISFTSRAAFMVEVRNACLKYLETMSKINPSYFRTCVTVMMDADVFLEPKVIGLLVKEAGTLGAMVAPGVLYERPNRDGSPRFYDTKGFVGTDGRPASLNFPFVRFDPYAPVPYLHRVLSVGTVYALPSCFLQGFRFSDTPGFTEHYSLCEHVRKIGGAVLMHRGLFVTHEDLTKYGEAAH